jgi:hypothetical protein
VEAKRLVAGGQWLVNIVVLRAARLLRGRALFLGPVDSWLPHPCRALCDRVGWVCLLFYCIVMATLRQNRAQRVGNLQIGSRSPGENSGSNDIVFGQVNEYYRW